MGGQIFPQRLDELEAKPTPSKENVLHIASQIFRPSTGSEFLKHYKNGSLSRETLEMLCF
jgi:hypothetical protein